MIPSQHDHSEEAVSLEPTALSPMSDHAAAQAAEESIWRNRGFVFVFSSYSLSLLGNTFHSIALNLWILQTTGSAKLMSAVLITHLVISMAFSSIAGTLADRINRRLLMWSSDLLRFFLVAIIALLIFIDTSSYIAIIGLTACVAFISCFRTPAFQASLIEIVGKRQMHKAIAAINISDNLVRILGFALGGAAVALLGGAIAIAMDAAAFLLSAILVFMAGAFRYEAIKQSQRPKNSFAQDLATGFTFVWQHAIARASLFILPLVMLSFLSNFMLVQVMAVKEWQAGPILFGIIEMCIPIGYVLGSLLIMKANERINNRALIITTSIILMGACFIFISLLPNVYLALPFILFVGFLFSFSTTIIFILLRTSIAPELQGRVTGLISSVTSIAPPIGLALFSMLADEFGAPIIMLCSGGLLLGIGLLLSKAIMRSFANASKSLE